MTVSVSERVERITRRMFFLEMWPPKSWAGKVKTFKMAPP